MLPVLFFHVLYLGYSEGETFQMQIKLSAVNSSRNLNVSASGHSIYQYVEVGTVKLFLANEIQFKPPSKEIPTNTTMEKFIVLIVLALTGT